MALIINCLKSERFQWTPVATKAFTEIKRMMMTTPIMRLPEFSTCDASRLAIGGVLSNKNHLVAYFNEKLNDA